MRLERARAIAVGLGLLLGLAALVSLMLAAIVLALLP